MNIIRLLHLLFSRRRSRLLLLLMVLGFAACMRSQLPYSLSDKLEKDPAHKTVEPELSKVLTKSDVEQVLYSARSYIGKPHLDKAADGIDCSGLTKAAYSAAGFKLPPNSADQSLTGKEIGRNELQPGDLVFFGSPANRSQISHVGMVTRILLPEQVDFIHTSTSRGVVEESMLSRYWTENYIKAVRPFSF